MGLYQPTSAGELGKITREQQFMINNLTLGVNYRIAQVHSTDLVLGTQLTGSMPDKALQEFYGKMPISGEIYLRLSPSLMTMRNMKHSGHGGMGSMKGMHH